MAMPGPRAICPAIPAIFVLGACTGLIGEPSDDRLTPREADSDPPPGVQVLPDEACAVTEAGASPLARLTKEEYADVIQDVLELDSTGVEAILGADSQVGPFLANTDAVALVHVDQYASAAETVAILARPRLDALAGCDPVSAGRESCMEALIRGVGARLFRRPLSEESVQIFRALQAAESSFSDGATTVLETMLQSPQFIYHFTLSASPDSSEGWVTLDGYDLASRLSFFLWRSVPDELLRAAAAAGQLTDPEQVEAHARRMLQDPRAVATIKAFYVEILELHALPEMAKDYPEFTHARRRSMLEETTRFVEWVHYGDVPAADRFRALFESETAFVDDEMADHYGVAAGEPWEQVLLDPDRRAGILTHPSVLSVLGKAGQSAPVQRGVVVRERILCHELPSPPPNINVDDPPPDPDTPRRAQFEQHRTDPACSGCHSLIDPVGFGFENFDGMGRFRDFDGGEPVDASGHLTDTIDFDADGAGDADLEFNGAAELSRHFAQTEQVRACMTLQWFRFAHRRLETTRDGCAIRAALDRLESSGGDLQELIVQLAVSETLRHVDMEEGEGR